MADSTTNHDKLRCYWIGTEDEGGLFFIERTIQDARKHRTSVMSALDAEFVDVRIQWIRKANIEGLSRGAVDGQISDVEAYRRGMGVPEELYDQCDRCHRVDSLQDFGEGESILLLCSVCEGSEDAL